MHTDLLLKNKLVPKIEIFWYNWLYSTSIQIFIHIYIYFKIAEFPSKIHMKTFVTNYIYYIYYYISIIYNVHQKFQQEKILCLWWWLLIIYV